MRIRDPVREKFGYGMEKIRIREPRIRNTEQSSINHLNYLKGADGGGLEPEISLEILRNLPDETLEGKLADQQLRRLLVSPDLPEGDSAGPIPVHREIDG
jgi:hypothetical protein